MYKLHPGDLSISLLSCIHKMIFLCAGGQSETDEHV